MKERDDLDDDEWPFMRLLNARPCKRGYRDEVRWVPWNDRYKELGFHEETACRDFLFQKRWPNGFACPRPRCQGRRFTWLTSTSLKCGGCRQRVSLTAKTILHGTRTPLRFWFQAAFILTQPGGNARVIHRELGLTYKTAWTWCQKIRAVMELGTTLGSPFPPFDFEKNERSGTLTPLAYQYWFAHHGHFQWSAERPGGMGKCCERLSRADWSTPDGDSKDADELERWTLSRTGAGTLWARYNLFRSCAGSVSDKHLRAYMAHTEFRMNHAFRNPADAAVDLAGRFMEMGPRPYRAIVGKAPARKAIWFSSPSVSPIEVPESLKNRRPRSGEGPSPAS